MSDLVTPTRFFSFLDRSHIVAKPGFNRWLVPPAALAVHLCIGMSYGFSVFWLPLSHMLTQETGHPVAACAANAASFAEKASGTLRALTATDCEWTQFDLGWMFTLFFVFLGCAASLFGGWLERAGPRRAGVAATVLWTVGLMLGALGVYAHQLWLLWFGCGAIGGIGLGLGYISPVSTLIKWFPDKRGMATGMAIMGFGGGAMIGSPLANLLINGGPLIAWKGAFSFFVINGFKTATSAGVWQAFAVLAAGYFVFMLGGSFAYRVPPEGWRPQGWTPPAAAQRLIAQYSVRLQDAHKTPQFWLLWLALCFNVSAGIGIIGAASPMLQETFGGQLFGEPYVGFAQFTDAQKALAAAFGGGFVGLFSLFNIGGRFFWASLSDFIGRKETYALFFMLGAACFFLSPTLFDQHALAWFAGLACLIASMYGGGFATIPAYLADLFGAKYVGAIHGRLLTAWSTAGIIGPVIVNYLHDARVTEGVPRAHVYDVIFYVLGGLLIAGLVCNALIQPVDQKWHKEGTVALVAATEPADKSYGITRGRVDAQALLAWGIIGLPLLWGVGKAVENALKILH